MVFLKKTFFYSLLLLLVLNGMAKNCQAQEGNVAKGFLVNPFFQEVNLAKDQAEVNFSLEITNNTEKVAVLKLSVVDFGALDESGGVAFLGDSKNLTNKYALSSWISLEKDALVLNAGEKQAIRVTVQNKETLSPGGHYAAILAKIEAESGEIGDSRVALDSTFSSLIFARKVGGEVFGLKFKDLELTKGIFSFPQTARLRFQNTGNMHLTPRGIVKLSDPLGREVMKGIVNEDSSIVLPETFRVFPTNLKNVAPAFIPGNYKLEIAYRFDSLDEFSSYSENFLIIPPIGILVLLVVIGLGIFGVKFAKKKKTKK